MRINKLKFPTKLTKSIGLGEISLIKKNLGFIVALTGKNGSGKSRFLSLLNKIDDLITVDNIHNGYFSNFPNKLKEIELKYQANTKTTYYLSRNLLDVKISDDVKSQMKKKLKDLQTEQDKLQVEICSTLKTVIKDYIIVIDNDDIKHIKDKIDNTGKITSFQSNSTFPNIAYLNSESTINYINELSTELVIDEFNLRFETKELSDFESYKKFSILCDCLQKLLGKKLHYKSKKASINEPIKVEVLLNDEVFKPELLSPGEKTLFAYAILLYYHLMNSTSQLSDCIIVLDEPEKHLHPEAQITLINTLKELTSQKGQLFIATHSITILCQVDPNSIYLMKNGEIKLPSRNIPALAINELFNLDEHVENLKNFMFSISDWAFSHFISQCLCTPDVIKTSNPDDPQVKLFIKSLMRKKNYHILDFGCGEGRIPRAVFDSSEGKKKSIIFDAFEPNLDFQLALEVQQNIEKVYNTLNDLPANKYDLCLISNVLHEIEPTEWKSIFQVIQNSLKNNGVVLIMEDKFLSRGELAHSFGYIVLFEEELKILFNSVKLGFIKSDQLEYKERLLACLIPAAELNISEQSITESIRHLCKTTFEMVNSLHSQNANSLVEGKKRAHLMQLYFNAQKYLMSIE